MKKFLAVVVAVPLAVLLATGVAPAYADDNGGGGPTFVVDDNLQCPNAQFPSIQLAVTVAPPGSRILVCPGVYNEHVTVPKTLTLRAIEGGFGSDDDDDSEDERCTQPQPPDPSEDAIVQDPAAIVAIFDLLANGIVLDGFTVQDNAASAGIYTSPAFSGYRIKENTVQHNVFGLYLNSSGATRSFVTENCFRRNNNPGSASGNGFYSDQGLRNARIEDNEFFQNDNGNVLTGTVPMSVVDVSVRDNSSLEDGSLVAIFLSRNATIADNEALRNAGSSIFVGGDNDRLTIDDNELRQASFRGIRFNAGAFGMGPNTNVKVVENEISRMDLSGISVAPDSLIDSRFVENESRRNGEDGIRIEAGGNADNFIIENELLRNAEFDCRDDTVGPGTAGTANTWKKNEARTENRPGLCREDDDD